MSVKYEAETLRPVAELPKWLAPSLPVGEQIRGIREALGMTQTQLAARSGFPQSMVAEIESGKRANLSLSTIQKLAAALRCRPFVQMIPEKEISRILDEQSTEVARRIVSAATGSAAIELQGPSPKTAKEEVQKLKKGLLKKHQSGLWQKI